MQTKHTGLIAAGAAIALLLGGLGVVAVSQAQNMAGQPNTIPAATAPADQPTTGAPGGGGPDGQDGSGRAPRTLRAEKMAEIAKQLGLDEAAATKAFKENRRDWPALVTALATASGKDEATVKSVLTSVLPDRMLERASEIAKKLGIEEANVKNILEENRGDHDATVAALVKASGKDEATVLDVLRDRRPGMEDRGDSGRGNHDRAGRGPRR